MYASLADRSSRQLLKRLARLDVLLIDEFGYLNLKPEQSNIFFKLMEERYRQHSTIITTNLVYDEWPNFLGNRPMVEALLSRLRHYCHTVGSGGSVRGGGGFPLSVSTPTRGIRLFAYYFLNAFFFSPCGGFSPPRFSRRPRPPP